MLVRQYRFLKKSCGRRVGPLLARATVAPDLPVLVAEQSFQRSQDLMNVTNAFMLDVPDGPEMIDKKHCMLSHVANASMVALLNCDRAAVIADQASDIYKTPWSGDYVSKQKNSDLLGG